MTATSSNIGGGAIREETFSDISLAPSTMASPFVGGGGGDQAPLQMHQTNPLEDLDAFGQGGPSIIGGMSGGGQGYDQGQSGSSYTSGGGGNTATEMLINQASSITANFQQALPAVASTVFSHFSNYLKGATPQPKPQETQMQNPQGFSGAGFDGGINQPPQYASPLDDIYHQQMSNPTESVNQMPLFISPEDAPTPGQMPPTTAAGATAQNTYRIGGQKKKTYAPPPIQGFSTQTPGTFTPGYDPTAPIQSGAPVMPPLPPMPGQSQIAPQVTPIPQRPPSVPQMQPPEIASNPGAGITPAPTPTAPTMTPTPMFMPPQTMEQPGFPPLPPQNEPQAYQQDQQPQHSFFQPPTGYATPAFPNPHPTSQYNPEPEKSKFSLTSFFTSNPIIDRLQGKSPNQYEGNTAAQQGYQANEGAYQQFAGIGVGSNAPPQTQQSPMPTINPNVFNTSPLQAPPMAASSVPTLHPGENPPMNPNSAMGSFFNPQQQQQSAIQPPMVPQSPSFPAAATGFNPPQPSMNPPTQAATSRPPPMQEPPKAISSGASAPGGYRMTKSRPAYANPNLIAQSHTTSGFMAMDRIGESPPAPTQWFNPAGAVTPAPEVAPQQSQNFFTPGAIAPNEVKPEVPPPTQWFNPIGSVAPAPKLAPPTPQMSSFFTPGAPATPTEVKQEISTPPPTPIDENIPQAPLQMPFVPVTPQPMLFNPGMINTQEVTVTSSTPDLIVPPSQGPAKEDGNNQEQSFFTPTEIQDPIQKDVMEQPSPPPTSGFTPNPTPTSSAPAVAQLNPIPSSNFFDSASFGGPQQPQKEENVQSVTFANLSNEQQNALPTTTAMFQPVNFFNAFSTQPTPQQLGTKEAMINEQLHSNQSEGKSSVFQPQPTSSTPTLEPLATMLGTFEPATLPMDNNANNILTSAVESTGQQQEINTEVITAGQGEVPVTGGNFWSERDDNANIVASEILSPPSVATTAHSDSFFNVSTTAVRADETLDEDFLSSFEKVDNSKFFDSPPDVQPTDPIANPNFFKSFMKAKFNATLMDEFNDQSLVVEPPSHDDSSISLSSYPSFDQSSSAPMGSVTDSGFQVSGGNCGI